MRWPRWRVSRNAGLGAPVGVVAPRWCPGYRFGPLMMFSRVRIRQFRPSLPPWVPLPSLPRGHFFAALRVGNRLPPRPHSARGSNRSAEGAAPPARSRVAWRRVPLKRPNHWRVLHRTGDAGRAWCSVRDGERLDADRRPVQAPFGQRVARNRGCARRRARGSACREPQGVLAQVAGFGPSRCRSCRRLPTGRRGARSPEICSGQTRGRSPARRALPWHACIRSVGGRAAGSADRQPSWRLQAWKVVCPSHHQVTDPGATVVHFSASPAAGARSGAWRCRAGARAVRKSKRNCRAGCRRHGWPAARRQLAAEAKEGICVCAHRLAAVQVEEIGGAVGQVVEVGDGQREHPAGADDAPSGSSACAGEVAGGWAEHRGRGGPADRPGSSGLCRRQRLRRGRGRYGRVSAAAVHLTLPCDG